MKILVDLAGFDPKIGRAEAALPTPSPALEHNADVGGRVMSQRDVYHIFSGDSKVCRKCGERRDLHEFSPNKLGKGGRHSVCTPCRSLENFIRNKNPSKREIEEYREGYRKRDGRYKKEPIRFKHLRLKYGVSPLDYEKMLTEQKGGCALCGKKKPGGRFDVFVVDHCHDTGCVRGLLCHSCNVGLGKLGDNEEGLMRALRYVQGRTD